MEDFCGMDEWGLQAVVRGSSGDFSNMVDSEQYENEFFSVFHQNFEATASFSDELEELYKPFYPVADSVPVVQIKEEEEENFRQKKQIESDHFYGMVSSGTNKATAVYTPKYKRRKNHQKRVVIQVTSDGISSDVWAWRKYGQKPIKGSPYPRSYYRCSSSKGCLARKQVEQSCTDPGMFIVTYTAEHSHSQPTRRNSLAGTIRQKFPATNKNAHAGANVKHEKPDDPTFSSPISAQPLPAKALSVSCNEEDLSQARIKQESKEGMGDIAVGDRKEFVFSDMIFTDDFFSGLEELDEFNAELSVQHSSSQQFPVSSCS